MPKAMTTEQFKQRVYRLVKEEYEVLGDYFMADVKIRMRHGLCQHQYEVRPTDFLQGRRCPNCYQKRKLTTEQFKEKVYAQVGTEYIVLGEYQGALQKIQLKHQMCGHQYEVRPSQFLGGNRCPNCVTTGRPKKTTEEFKQDVDYEVKGEYIVLGEYRGALQKIKFKHLPCQTEYEVTPNNFLRGCRCPTCHRRGRPRNNK